MHAYRGKTTVLWLRSKVLDHERLMSIVGDMALLSSLGLRLVVLFDAHDSHNNPISSAQITAEQLLNITAEIGQRRYAMEAMFSQGITNSPMHGANVNVVSGNFISARPAGVVDGVDLMAQGRVRRVNHLAIREQLDNQNLVLIPPLGYSITGDILYLSPDNLVVEVAKHLNADKVVIVGDNPHPSTDGQKEMSLDALKGAISQLNESSSGLLELKVAHNASMAGIPRCHIIDGHEDGALLSELFTRDGVGTLVARDSYDTFRKARANDISGIAALLKPLEDQQILVKRDQETLENDIGHYLVNERDGMIIGCAAVFPLNEHIAEIASLAVHPDYQKGGRGNALLNAAEREARQLQLKEIFVLTTQTEHWFIERGFRAATVQDLPENKQRLYNIERNSKVYIKSLVS
ncbi:amino-acid N-acetyltransferase [Reinekea marina]|uniref:amino-acid N-acetyltransferase n=1 Tax=Reinekea marina TaxID=1310421 RepID=UPI0025B4CC9F|nr:amino-acid N-acetyltransferase [Reinekea marina]MDN3648491.1 amino-acid N-acetyltransferase [Reinekea marina]